MKRKIDKNKLFDDLTNMINNAGWEEKRSRCISLLVQERNKIIDEYLDFLP